jgi:hypothetical protein
LADGRQSFAALKIRRAHGSSFRDARTDAETFPVVVERLPCLFHEAFVVVRDAIATTNGCVEKRAHLRDLRAFADSAQKAAGLGGVLAVFPLGAWLVAAIAFPLGQIAILRAVALVLPAGFTDSVAAGGTDGGAHHEFAFSFHFQSRRNRSEGRAALRGAGVDDDGLSGAGTVVDVGQAAGSGLRAGPGPDGVFIETATVFAGTARLDALGHGIPLAVFWTVALVLVQGVADEISALETDGARAVRARALAVLVLYALVGSSQSVAAKVIEVLVGASQPIAGDGYTADLAGIAPFKVLFAMQMAASVHLHAGQRNMAYATGVDARLG